MHRPTDHHPPIARRTAAALAAAVMALVLGLVAPATPGGAQASFVVVTTRTSPELPDAGDDVTVSVRAQGCPPGGARVEIYLRTDDRVVASDALMVREEVSSTLFFRVSEEIELPNARTGWYGARVVCGQFRPDRGPMANTWFRVGEPGPLPLEVSGDQVAAGGALRVRGEGCGGGTVTYAFSAREGREAFAPLDEIPVSPLGTFDAAVTFPENASPGPVTLQLRCQLFSPYGDDIWLFYEPTLVRVVAA